MKVVVVTGSTRGIGHGLARSFLELGCSVVVSGRSQEKVDEAVLDLAAAYEPACIKGKACDVRRFDQVEALWHAARTHYGRIDIWVNNAGVGYHPMPFWEQEAPEVEAVIGTNMIGTMIGTLVAYRGMMNQGYGALYNMEGLGSNGRRVEGLTLYGSSKYGLRYFNEGLIRETRQGPVLVGVLHPGMVMTDMLKGRYFDHPQEWQKVKWIFNLLADKVGNITPRMAGEILANRKHGARIAYLTPGRLFLRLLEMPFRKPYLLE